MIVGQNAIRPFGRDETHLLLRYACAVFRGFQLARYPPNRSLLK